MTWSIWNEYTDHGRARNGSLQRGWAQRETVGYAAWPRATMTGRGLCLALGGVWCMHWQAGHAPSAVARAWTQAPLLTYLQAVMRGVLSWCATVLVVATRFLGLILLAASIQRVHTSGGKEPTTGGAQDADVAQWA